MSFCALLRTFENIFLGIEASKLAMECKRSYTQLLTNIRFNPGRLSVKVGLTAIMNYKFLITYNNAYKMRPLL